MATKTIYMNENINEGSDGEYVYPNSDDDDVPPNCGESECSDGIRQEQEQEYNQEEYPEFYENLEVVSEQTQNKNQTVKTKPRSMSFDSEGSDASKRPNFKCGSCKKSFLLDKNQKMIRCSYCGYRILFKLRTRNYITYKTE
jgi:DNA-directed RNA polymerase subunit RPC12/RpoP